MKKLLLVLLALMLLAPGLAAARTLSYTNEETGFTAVIDDDASLLDSAEYDSVLESMKPLTQYCGVGFYTYGGTSTEYVKNKAEKWGNSTFPGEFTLLIIDMATRQLMVGSSAKIMDSISQAKAYTITDNVYTYATRGEYGRCAETAFNQMYRALKGEKVTGPMQYISNALLALAAAILLAYLFISARMEQEVKVSLPEVVTATVGAGAAIASRTLTRTVRHTSSGSGGRGGGFSGGHGGGFSGGGFGGGSHGF